VNDVTRPLEAHFARIDLTRSQFNDQWRICFRSTAKPAFIAAAEGLGLDVVVQEEPSKSILRQ
jgi:hypothetical protein